MQGAWWLLNLSKETRINDTPVDILDLVALAPGMKISLGRVTLQFQEA